MRVLSTAILLLLFVGCDNEDAPDCLKSSGELVSQTIEVATFNELLVNNEFEVVLTQGATIEVKLTVGENILKEIDFISDGVLLEVSNNISCKWVRDYDFPLLEITHPNISAIEIIGGSTVRSNGVLTIDNISFRSKSSNGIFNLTLNADNVSIDNNEITNYFIEGSANNLNLVYSSGNGRFEGANFLVNDAIISHNGSNDIIVNVSNELSGSIGSTGDLVYVGEPPAVINVTTDNRGKLIDGTD